MKKFQKKIEDFTCEHCGNVVAGKGYTNHCPQCLWSKHVDINPGDRKATCLGLMQPIGGGRDHRGEYILHKCVVCGHQKRNKLSLDDSFDAFIKVIQKMNELLSRGGK